MPWALGFTPKITVNAAFPLVGSPEQGVKRKALYLPPIFRDPPPSTRTPGNPFSLPLRARGGRCGPTRPPGPRPSAPAERQREALSYQCHMLSPFTTLQTHNSQIHITDRVYTLHTQPSVAYSSVPSRASRARALRPAAWPAALDEKRPSVSAVRMLSLRVNARPPPWHRR